MSQPVTPPAPKGGFHIWGFDPTSQKSTSMAGLLMSGFLQIIQDFETSMGNSVQQLKDIKKLMTEANTLYKLLNEVTDPSTKEADLTALYNKIKTAIGALSAEIKAIAAKIYPDGHIPAGSYLAQLQNQLSTVSAVFTETPFASVFANYLKIMKKIQTDFQTILNGGQVNPESLYNLAFEFNGIPTQLKKMIKALKRNHLMDPIPIGLQRAVKALNDWGNQIAVFPFNYGSWRFFGQMGMQTSKQEGISYAKELISWMQSSQDPLWKNPKMQSAFFYSTFTSWKKQVTEEAASVVVPPDKWLLWIRMMSGPLSSITLGNWTVQDAYNLQGEMGGLWNLWAKARSNSEQMIDTVSTFSNSTITDINKDYTGINTVATLMAKLLNVPIRDVNQALQNLRKGL